MPPRPGLIAERDKGAERALRDAQRAVIRGSAALDERNRLLAALFDNGYTQRELVDVLNVACRAAQAPELSEDAVQKAIRGRRK